MARAPIILAAFLALCSVLAAQEVTELVAAAADMAATFSRTAPGLAAREVLHQHGRRGIVSILQAKNANVTLPQEFRTHDVVSDYAFGQIGATHAIHEIRSILTIDGRVISSADEARHALAIGVQSPDDELKHRLLENFERNRLEGAVTDFGQLLLLFSAAGEKNYTFTLGHRRQLHNEPMIALNYKQISGSDGLTVFHEHVMDVRTTEGEIWFRTSDLVPLRITMYTEKTVSGNLTIRDTAVVDYTPTEFGLAPAHVDHMQFLGSDLLVENDLQYSGYQRLTPGNRALINLMPELQAGSAAPDFELPDAHGNIVRLRDFRAKSPVVVYFYPKDDTTVCTKQACAFRNDIAKFREAGAVILGISGDSEKSHAAFAEKYSLPFPLLSDQGGLVRKLFGVKKKFGVIPGRVTFVIDRGGVVRLVYSGLAESDKHVQEALAALKQI